MLENSKRQKEHFLKWVQFTLFLSSSCSRFLGSYNCILMGAWLWKGHAISLSCNIFSVKWVHRMHLADLRTIHCWPWGHSHMGKRHIEMLYKRTEIQKGGVPLTHMYWASSKLKRQRWLSEDRLGWVLKSSASKCTSWNTQCSWYAAVRRVLRKETELNKRRERAYRQWERHSFYHSRFDDFFLFFHWTLPVQSRVIYLRFPSAGFVQ